MDLAGSLAGTAMEEKGRLCALQSGHLDGVAALSEEASACTTPAARAAFLRGRLGLDAELEEGCGILLRLHKQACTCPNAPAVPDPQLCNCTAGHEKAVWSALFGWPAEVEIVESFQRGGRDCVVRLLL